MTREEANHLSIVLKAFSEGKAIQMLDNDGWKDGFTGINLCSKPFSYRIKPEPKLRPFDNSEDFVKMVEEHGKYIKLKGSAIKYLPIYVDNLSIGIHTLTENMVIILPYNELLAKYEFTDGTPCGIIEY